MSSDDDSDSTVSDGEYESTLDPDVDMHMEDDVYTCDGFVLDGNVDTERDDEDESEADEEEEDEKEEEAVDEDEEEDKDEEEDEDEEEDYDENDGKEPRTIGEEQMVNTSPDDVDTMVED
jgi:hypothetical protein